ncbi:MAG TPA: hypothetical protein VHE37_12640 [Nevskiaceae bacterium]|nr:hypothetical protein [Nevskiaceae bacterium]
MGNTRIIVHLPAHRRAALNIERDLDAPRTYDRYIGEYIEFLRKEGIHAGFDLTTDERDDDKGIFTIDEMNHEAKRKAHAWLETQPDIWNWIP